MTSEAIDLVLFEGTQPWMQHGECAGIGPENDRIFFPQRGESSSEARTMCAKCKVTEDCLEYALRTNQQYGIWGGTSNRERKRIRLERAARSGLA